MYIRVDACVSSFSYARMDIHDVYVVNVCMCILYTYVCLGVCLSTCIYVVMYVYGCMFVWVHVFGCMLQRCGFVRAIQLVIGDPNPIQVHVRYGPDTLAIRRSTHEMIWRFVSVRTVETRRRFDSKTASFHVSVCLLVCFNSSILSHHFMWICFWFLYYSIYAQLLLYCDALVLFYWYIVYTVIDLVQYSKYMSIRNQ